ncbi:uncharacterized protein HHUB_3544 [Halobacterium hubeiense]|uniref:Uncharacterized protein n=1 Tax=Halobacterium hubeiense TaxID=1407499 RepID=A0A0U5D0U6_9EURY|nr:hypothetical protein [Halobacterium hubeiense]CQH61778.1 uncharacterized protein HHUB_3544 [Halobacterium hubeiense]
MNGSRVASIVLALAAVSVLATGTLGFTSVSAERGVSVSVVDSESAYVGVTACAPTHSENETGNGSGAGSADVYVTVTNQYSTPVVVEGIEGDGGNDGDLDDSSRVIPVGETKKYSLQFEAREVTVDATADAFDATVTATVVEKRRHDCNPSQP